MHLIGLAWRRPGAPPSMALVRRDLRNLAKHYRLVDAHAFPASSSRVDIMNAVIARHGDDRFQIRKPRFNQIGRPGRMVYARPLILMTRTGPGGDIVDALRNRRLAVESFEIAAIDKWTGELHAPGRGYDFRVGSQDLLSALDCVLKENRFAIDPVASPSPVARPVESLADIRHAMGNVMRDGEKTPSAGMLTAIALPVWYYEHLLRIRPKAP